MSSLVRSSLVSSLAAVAALSAVLSTPASAQPASSPLGHYEGCSLYACYQFTFAELGRSGPVTPFPGGPDYPQNVPSYLVHYALIGSTRVLPQAVADGVTDVQAYLPWFFNDGAYGDGGCCESFGHFSFAGLAAGTRISWSIAEATAPFVPLSGYVAVGAPSGTTGVSFGTSGFETYATADDVWGQNDFTLRGPPAPFATIGVQVLATPEPSTVALVLTGLAALLGVARVRSRRGGTA